MTSTNGRVEHLHSVRGRSQGAVLCQCSSVAQLRKLHHGGAENCKHVTSYSGYEIPVCVCVCVCVHACLHAYACVRACIFYCTSETERERDVSILTKNIMYNNIEYKSGN